MKIISQHRKQLEQTFNPKSYNNYEERRFKN